MNKNSRLSQPLLGHSTNISGVSLATMPPTAGRKPVKCQSVPKSCSFCVLPGSLAFCIHPDYSCKSRPRQGSSKSIVFHTMAPVTGAFSVAIPSLLQGLEFLLASAGSHEHSSFISHPCFCPSALCPPSAEAENTRIEETNSTQTCVTPTASYCCPGLLCYCAFPASLAQVSSEVGPQKQVTPTTQGLFLEKAAKEERLFRMEKYYILTVKCPP